MKKQVRFSLEKGDLLPTLLMLPALIMIVFVMIVPLIYGLSLSFFEVGFGETNFKENFVGASNYLRFFQDATAKKAVFNTLLFSLGATAGDLFFGTLGAALLLKVSERLGKVLRPIVTVPLLVSPIIVGLIWRYIYDVKRPARFVDVREYDVDSEEKLYGFIAGMLAQNFDITAVYLDAFLHIIGKKPSEIENLITGLTKLAAINNVKLVINVSGKIEEMPAFLKDLVI